jgi:hypothetical protein
MKPTKIFDKYESNLNLLIENELIDDEYFACKNHYICPICLNKYDKLQSITLTLEDAPQKAIGGKKNTLTCKKCNNEAGLKIDHHLVNRLIELDNAKLEEGTQVAVKTDIDGKIFNATLTVEKNGKMKMFHSDKNNNPQAIEENIPDLKPNKIIEFNFTTKKIIQNNLDYAVLKSAYIILFQHTGYKIILNKQYNIIREQILNPEKRLIPEKFYFFSQELLLNDGIHFICDKGFEIILVIFTATTYNSQRNFCVFLPIPNKDYENTLKNIFDMKAEGKDPELKGFPKNINDVDYLFDLERIKRLDNWFKTY